MEDDLTIYITNENSYEKDDNHALSDEEEDFTNLQTCAISCETSSAESSRSNSPLIYGHDRFPKVTGIRHSLELYRPKSFDDVLRSIHCAPYQFIFMAIPKKINEYKQCRIVREKSGLSQIFYLEIELENNQQPVCLLTAKKEMKMIGQSQYVISLNPNFHREFCSAELVCNNRTGTSYALYVSHKDQYQELAVISYESNFLGLKGPRKIDVVLSSFEHQEENASKNTSIHLHNKTPIWIEETCSYALPFQGKNRVLIPSVKNFQLVIETKSMKEQMVMQFGRMLENEFSCDFRYPFSFVQAFAVGLSAFESGLFRE